MSAASLPDMPVLSGRAYRARMPTTWRVDVWELRDANDEQDGGLISVVSEVWMNVFNAFQSMQEHRDAGYIVDMYRWPPLPTCE